MPQCSEREARFSPNGRSTQHSRRVIRLTRRTATNLTFYSEFAVHNILQYYSVTGEDDKLPGSIPGDTMAIGLTEVADLKAAWTQN